MLVRWLMGGGHLWYFDFGILRGMCLWWRGKVNTKTCHHDILRIWITTCHHCCRAITKTEHNQFIKSKNYDGIILSTIKIFSMLIFVGMTFIIFYLLNLFSVLLYTHNGWFVLKYIYSLFDFLWIGIFVFNHTVHLQHPIKRTTLDDCA